MTTSEFENIHARLKKARIAAHYADAADAARAMGVPTMSYQAHENGNRGLSRSAARYAKFFGISLEWLMNGRGDMKGRRRVVPVDGQVGAGALVEQFSDPDSWAAPRDIEIPSDVELAALLVRGDSQYPRYLDGEFILYDRRTLKASDVAGGYAIVQTLDGRRLVKIVQPCGAGAEWRLESHNAPPETAAIMAAWRVVGVVTPHPAPRFSAPPPKQAPHKPK